MERRPGIQLADSFTEAGFVAVLMQNEKTGSEDGREDIFC